MQQLLDVVIIKKSNKLILNQKALIYKYSVCVLNFYPWSSTKEADIALMRSIGSNINILSSANLESATCASYKKQNI